MLKLFATVLLVFPALGFNSVDDPSLDQELAPDMEVVAEQTVITDGHIDFGPTLLTGEFRALIHDDTQVPAVWRTPEQTVLQVGENAKSVVPAAAGYEFIGAEAGAEVYVLGQTQQAGLVWPGWNTQDPALMEQVSRGAEMSLIGVSGPGELSVFLHDGSFGAPEVLWTSTRETPQPLWVELNTHAHANWVFTQPGIYVAEFAFNATGNDGTDYHTTAALRFAVGEGVDPQAAFAATTGSAEDNSTANESAVNTDSAATAEPADEAADNTLQVVMLLAATAVAIVGLIALLVIAIVNKQAKKRALSDALTTVLE